jgi:hypothetical protein
MKELQGLIVHADKDIGNERGKNDRRDDNFTVGNFIRDV